VDAAPVRQSALTHSAEAGAKTATLLAYSGHTSMASLVRYANPRELQQTGEKPQLTSSARVPSGSIWRIAHAA
jgi:hypothetical protein